MTDQTQPTTSAFAETAALYAIMTDDISEARRIIRDMLPSERVAFAEQLDSLARIARGTPATIRELLGDRR
jgi:hypothetical protein